MVTLEYNANSKLITASDAVVALSTETNIDQINVLTTSLIGETNPNFTPQPNEALSKMIKGLFESGMKLSLIHISNYPKEPMKNLHTIPSSKLQDPEMRRARAIHFLG